MFSVCKTDIFFSGTCSKTGVTTRQQSSQLEGPGSILCQILKQKFEEQLKINVLFTLLLFPVNVRSYFASADAFYTPPS